jgi:ABC-2 type transport system permease protein
MGSGFEEAMLTIARYTLLASARDLTLVVIILLPIGLLTLFGLALDRREYVELLAPSFGGSQHPWASYYAAALAAIFLLFIAARSAELLREEEESGFLARLTLVPIGERALIAGKSLALLSLLLFELILLFGYGRVAFDITPFRHPALFLAISGAAALTALAIGLALAAFAPSRRALTSIALLVIVLMALPGGSVLPAILLPDWLADPGHLTFNHQVIAGYAAITGEARSSVVPHVAGLAAPGIVLAGAAALTLARRLRRIRVLRRAPGEGCLGPANARD